MKANSFDTCLTFAYLIQDFVGQQVKFSFKNFKFTLNYLVENHSLFGKSLHVAPILKSHEVVWEATDPLTNHGQLKSFLIFDLALAVSIRLDPYLFENSQDAYK